MVYIDVLFLLNFGMDMLLIICCGRLLRRHISLWRCIVAALTAALYGIGIVLPLPPLLYQPAAAVLFSLLLLLIAYGYGSAASFLRLIGAFYLCTCVLGGSVLALYTALERGLLRPDALPLMKTLCLFAALPPALLLTRCGYTLLRRQWQRDNFSLLVDISIGGRSLRLPGLIDTGNYLREPLSGHPVAVANYSDIAPLLPMQLRKLITTCPELPSDELLHCFCQQADGDEWARRLRLIPFASIGQQHGLLLGFRPDRLVLHQSGREIQTSGVIAISMQQRQRGHPFLILLNPELLTYAVIEEVSA